MSALQSALRYERLSREHPLLSTLRKDSLALIGALLEEHLSQPGQRIDTDELHDLIDADLRVLRNYLDLGDTNAKGHCDRWREAGILLRSVDPVARGEIYELSAAGHELLLFLERLETPQAVVTESRLVSLTAALHRLAIETDSDRQHRLEALERQRADIDEQIAALDKRKPSILDAHRAQERVRDILDQARALPADFARVRARIEEINRGLRASIISTDESAGQILHDVWEGVDLLSASEEGRTFAAFAALVRDPEQSAMFDDDVAALLGREFSEGLSRTERAGLRSLRRSLYEGNRDVQSTLTGFAHSLRRYVFSQEFRRDRVLQEEISQALADALELVPVVKPYQATGFELELSAMRLFSVGTLEPWDPAVTQAAAPLVVEPDQVVSFADLANKALETEIDFEQLRRDVNEVLSNRSDDGGGVVTVGEVLQQFPARQGLASIVGLLALAAKHGKTDPTQVDVLEWVGADNVKRWAEVERHGFTQRLG